MNKEEEQVLCFSKEASAIVRNAFSSLYATEERTEQDVLAVKTVVSTLLNTPGCSELRARGSVETDDTYLQLIPYVAIVNNAGDVLVYDRTKKGSEERLRNKSSIGFGGHINTDDVLAAVHRSFTTGNPGNVIVMSAMRELHEELKISHSAPMFLTSELIYDPTNPVSKVHLGIVIVVSVDELPESNEDKIGNLRFMSVDDAKSIDTLETWSSILLGFMGDIVGKVKDAVAKYNKATAEAEAQASPASESSES